MTTAIDLLRSHHRGFRIGDVGDDVRQLQAMLTAKGFDTKGADGEVGKDTRAAIVAFQRANGLLDDGEVGELTATALDGEAAPLPAAAAAPTQSAEPPWLKRAVSLIGTLEAPDSRDNPVILAWARACGGNIAATYKHDSVPWCKMFVEYCLRSTGYHGNDTLWALDSRKIGTALADPAVGAIASKARVGGGHTFFVRGRTASGDVLVGVGGNQSDCVCNANFHPSELKYNWPDGYPLPRPGFANLPVLAAGKFTREN